MSLKRTVVALATAAASLIGTFAVGAPTAHASAYGCNGWRNVSVKGNNVPLNNYCVSLDGTGTFVRSVRGNFSSNVGTVCNYNVTAEFFDSAGNWYMTKASPVKWGCKWGTDTNAGTIVMNQHVRRGTMCSTLRQNGARITSVCHSIW